MKERWIARFRGHVQGVGFRYTVERIAAGYPRIAGEVYNASDHVVVDAEGEPEDLRDFIDAIGMQPARSARITSTDIATAPPTGARGFRIGPTR